MELSIHCVGVRKEMEVTNIEDLYSTVRPPTEYEKGYIAGRHYEKVQGNFVDAEPLLGELRGRVRFSLEEEVADMVTPTKIKIGFRGAYRNAQRILASTVLEAKLRNEFESIKGSKISKVNLIGDQLIADFTVEFKRRTIIPFFPRAQEQADIAYQRTDKLSYEEAVFYLLTVDSHLIGHQANGYFGRFHEFFFKFLEYKQVEIFERPQIVVEFINDERIEDITIIRKVGKGQFREVRHHYERVDPAVRKRIYDEEVDEVQDKLYYLTHVKDHIYRLTSMGSFNSLLVWVTDGD